LKELESSNINEFIESFTQGTIIEESSNVEEDSLAVDNK
jgi:hypothetical protein